MRGLIDSFATDLRELVRSAGSPSLRDLAKASGVPGSTLGDLLAGRFTRVPPWDRVRAVVEACGRGEDLGWWRKRHGSLERDLSRFETNSHPPIRTRYLHQVARIAPPELLGRETELSDLAAFCAGDEWYQWWRAPAWAGKSALMSWFVLNPPPGVRVVAFFVTARLAGQADRVAFVDNVLEQLFALSGEQPPQLLSAATRESHLLGLLTDAAARCRKRGEVLALVVDGLDEDRGITTAPDSHSIAALLPAHPIDGLRVVVAGRPDPPVPADVPPDHPLRDRSIVRELSVSPRANALRVEMERDLRHLVHGSPLQRDLLGLLVAAGGGLTADDLAVLTDSSTWEVQDHLNTVTGRSFTRRDDAYLLAHEELHRTATDMLGRHLDTYRDRLHGWADGYLAAGWPVDTPDYLLRAYHTTLLSAGDLARATTLCLDKSRRERMLESTSGDHVCLAQIVATIDAHVALDPPDLVTISRLAVHRDHLVDRNAHIPVELPALWARLGNPRRGIALARSISDDRARVWALVALLPELAKAAALSDELIDEYIVEAQQWSGGNKVSAVARTLATAGQVDRAVELARSTPDPDEAALWGVVDMAVAAGQVSRAVEIAQSLEIPVWRANALARVAPHRPELLEDAMAAACVITEPLARDETLMSVARVLAECGHRDRAEHVARSIHQPRSLCYALLAVAKASTNAGEPDVARRLLDELASQAGSLDDSLFALVSALIEDGQHDRALRIANSRDDLDDRLLMMEEVACALAVGGQVDRALAVLAAMESIDEGRVVGARASILAAIGRFDEAVSTALSIDPHRQKDVMAAVVAELVRVGQTDRAIEAVRSVGWVGDRSRHLVSLAALLVEDRDQATALLDEAERTARLSVSGYHRDHALVPVVRELAGVGLLDLGWAVVDSFGQPQVESMAVAEIAKTLYLAGRRGEAFALVDHAEDLADVTGSDAALAGVAQAHLEFERSSRAREAAVAIGDGFLRGRSLIALVEGLARTGQLDEAMWVAEESIVGSYQLDALVLVAEAAVAASREDLARTAVDLAEHGHDGSGWSTGLVAVAAVPAKLGEHDHARRLLAGAERRVRSETLEPGAAQAMLAMCLANAGFLDDARRVMRSMPDHAEQAGAVWGLATAFMADGRLAEAAARRLGLVGRYEDAFDLIRSARRDDRSGQALLKLARGVADPARAARLAALGLQTAPWIAATENLCHVSIPAALAVVDESARVG
ncbi:hypothetical protein [Actinokineospora inagensis]|uniref:hypothetical protein n=1 Tax=Actinokineospora inagensis TaxID=103730 RepID=UPI0004132495|nr:hypothetical protein [Actinokineospora inagensis]